MAQGLVVGQRIGDSDSAGTWRAMKKPREVIQPRWGVYLAAKEAKVGAA
jgi:hypothetical protein